MVRGGVKPADLQLFRRWVIFWPFVPRRPDSPPCLHRGSIPVLRQFTGECRGAPGVPSCPCYICVGTRIPDVCYSRVAADLPGVMPYRAAGAFRLACAVSPEVAQASRPPGACSGRRHTHNTVLTIQLTSLSVDRLCGIAGAVAAGCLRILAATIRIDQNEQHDRIDRLRGGGRDCTGAGRGGPGRDLPAARR